MRLIQNARRRKQFFHNICKIGLDLYTLPKKCHFLRDTTKLRGILGDAFEAQGGFEEVAVDGKLEGSTHKLGQTLGD